MRDLIDRQEAIDVIDAVLPVDPMKSEYAQGIACGAALAKIYVEQLPTAEPKWIPVTERLPELDIDEDNYGDIWKHSKPVLIYSSQPNDVGLHYTIGAYDEGDNPDLRYGWYEEAEGYEIYDVVAWMPLPEPYNKDDMRGENDK